MLPTMLQLLNGKEDNLPKYIGKWALNIEEIIHIGSVRWVNITSVFVRRGLSNPWMGQSSQVWSKSVTLGFCLTLTSLWTQSVNNQKLLSTCF